MAVESTFNWYWLVDGLQAAGFTVHLVNTAAVKQYDGLKHGGDFSDARHLAHLLRLGILPVGYIYPREERAVRDLLRKRSQLVRQRSTQILSIENLIARNLGARVSGNEVKRWDAKCIDAMELLDEHKQAVKANLVVMNCIDGQVVELERSILAKVKLREDFKGLKTVSGIGRDPGADHRAGDRRHRPLRWPRQLRLLCPHGGQPPRIQRQEEGRGKCQVWQQAPGVGLHRGGALRRALRRNDQALVPEEVRQQLVRRGHQGGGAQARACLLPRDQGWHAIRCGEGLRMRRRDDRS